MSMIPPKTNADLLNEANRKSDDEFFINLKLNPLYNDNRLWKPVGQDIPSFQDYIQKKMAEHVDGHFNWPKRKDIVDTIDIDHEVIEPKQLKSHEKQD